MAYNLPSQLDLLLAMHRDAARVRREKKRAMKPSKYSGHVAAHRDYRGIPEHTISIGINGTRAGHETLSDEYNNPNW